MLRRNSVTKNPVSLILTTDFLYWQCISICTTLIVCQPATNHGHWGVTLKPINLVLHSIKYYCQGKGSPLRLIFVWFFILNIISLGVGTGIYFAALPLLEKSYSSGISMGIISGMLDGLLGLILTFVYPFLFTYVMWKCSLKIKKKLLRYLNCFLIFPFWLAHSYLGLIYFMGSSVLLTSIWKCLKI
jgi:hypothetical protein